MRATGRTFYLLLRAIIAASEAKPGVMVTVCASNNNQARDLQKHAAGIIHAYVHSEGYIFNSRARTIEIVGAGVIEFMSNGERLDRESCCQVFPNLFIDHYTGRP